jgi:hypothetical protein
MTIDGRVIGGKGLQFKQLARRSCISGRGASFVPVGTRQCTSTDLRQQGYEEQS